MAGGKCCRGCSEKCLRTHYNRHGSSFFKVMAGEFSSILVNKMNIYSTLQCNSTQLFCKNITEVPSDWFKRSQIKGLKVAILEGPCGHLWQTKVHFSDKLTIFTEGWGKFVSDHWIQPEDIVVFRHVDDAHFLVQIFDVSGYEKKNTVTVKNCESHNLNKLGIYGTGAATFGQTVKGNPFKDASGDVNNVPRRITRSIGLKVAITGNCAEACIPNGSRHSTVKQEFPAHPKINVKQEPGLPKSNWNFSENKVGSSAKDPIILDSEEESDSQALSSYSHDKDSDEVSYHFSSEVLQGKVHPVLEEDKTANSVKKGKPKFTQRLWCLSTVFIQIQRSPQIRWSSRSWLPGSARLSSWSATPAPYEKKKLGVLDIYSKYPYLIQSAIDYEVCLQADTFEGNSFSTFSSVIVLQRTMRMDRAQDCEGSTVASYAYNIEGPAGGPKRWATNMSDLILAAISYGSNEVSC